MTWRHRIALLAGALTTAAIAVAPTSAHASSMPLLATCQGRSDSVDAFVYRMCTGFVPSFDGVPLDVDLTLPATAAPAGGYPLLVMMHGWGNSKTDWESADFCDSGSADKCNYNNVAFAHRGYAVLNYTARGFHGSCGPGSPNAASPACATGWTHLSDMRWEAHDTQFLAGVLVDAGVARPGIAVSGGSYGGGQSWLLALLANRVMTPSGALVPWRSPAGVAMHVAVAAPKYPWTDLVDALLPNGRASDGVTSPNGDRTSPYGIDKQSYVEYLYASGASSARYAAPSQDPTADLTTWHTEIAAGETPAESTYAPAIIDQITRFRSAYYQSGLITTDVAARTETPVFDMQGWTDALFPESQGASMIEKLRAADPGWPAFFYASDLGHPPANNMKFSEWRVINAKAAAFIGRYMGEGGGLPGAVYQEQLVNCGASAGAVFSGSSLTAIEPGRATFGSSEAGHATASAPSDSAAGAATDPLVFYIGNGQRGGCITLPGTLPANGAMSSWTFPVCTAFTMLGQPMLAVNATIAGTDAEVNARLWDVAQDGSVTLVTRGVYRWNGSPPGAASIGYALLGSGWTFAAGHRIRLEVTQNDAPYARLDNYASSIAYASISLTLPTTGSSAGC
ncbi:MAG TPA: CocE/NonD family hydrolase [Candidatus Dormibacteraeota bacterium]|nr:CocE/NonD family hydrolase [Candidatus Dormibacteraeota bacterium]